jgi:GH3 auxin-responsive promoter
MAPTSVNPVLLEAMHVLKPDVTAPEKTARNTLLRIIHENKDTMFGREFDFSSMTPENFKDRLQLANYQSVDKYIDRIVTGEANVLSSRTVDYFMTTSGTTGKSKLIPGGIGNHDIEDSLNFIQKGSHGATLLLVNTPSVYHDDTDKHRMVGPFSGIIVRKNVDEALRDPSSWNSVTPPQIHLLQKYDEFCYVAALYALKAPGLEVMRTTFLPNLLSFFQTVQDHWDDLMNDIRHGSLSIPFEGLVADAMSDLKAGLKPNAQRAEDLEVIFSQGTHDGLISRLWPQLAFAACITGGSFKMYVPRLKAWLGDSVIIFSPFMLGSEGFYGVNYSPGVHESLYHPSLTLTYFEFIEEKNICSINPNTIGIEELRVGGRYEMVITNNGLYRYRVGDVIEIKAMDNKMPLFDMCYRLGSVINMVGEKTSEDHLVAVLQKMEGDMGQRDEIDERKNGGSDQGANEELSSTLQVTQLIDFTMSVDMAGAAPRYIVYVELRESASGMCMKRSTARAWSSEKFDGLLKLANDQYSIFRDQGRLLEAQVKIVSVGLLKCLCELATARGTSEVQFKVPRLLTTELQRNLMEEKVLKIADLK